MYPSACHSSDLIQLLCNMQPMLSESHPHNRQYRGYWTPSPKLLSPCPRDVADYSLGHCSCSFVAPLVHQHSNITVYLKCVGQPQKLIDNPLGFVDKVTGDSSVAYFNVSVECDHLENDFIDCFLQFVQEESSFADDLVSDGTRSEDFRLLALV